MLPKSKEEKKAFDREGTKKAIRDLHGSITGYYGEFSKWNLRDWLINKFSKNITLRLYQDPLDGMTDDELLEAWMYFVKFCKGLGTEPTLEDYLKAPECCGGF